MDNEEENSLVNLNNIIMKNESMNNTSTKIYELINSVFKNKAIKEEIIEKLRPFFTLKVIPQREIDKVYSAVEKIAPEKIDFLEEFKYQEEKYDSKSIYETKSKSVGLSDFDLDLSASIFGHKQTLNYDFKEEKLTDTSELSSKIHCIHSIVVSLFRIVIDFKDIKLSKQINEELIEIQDSNATEKKILLEKFIDKFGLYIPLELLIGGRINISFDANNEVEKKQFHSLLQNKIQAEFKGSITNFSAQLNLKGEKKSINEKSSESINGIENLSIKMEGGDYLYKDDLKKWIKSFNINNLQIIEYKTLIPIYCFIQGMESKLSICLQKYEDIVIQEIHNLIEDEYKTEENNLFEDSSAKSNIWEVGIIKDVYKSFNIYRRRIIKAIKYKIDKKELKIKDVLCGKLPDGFIICGWILKTDSNSLPYEILSNWERKKDLNIIGNNCFKFTLHNDFEENINEDVEVEWILDIFCIHKDFLVPHNKKQIYQNMLNRNVEHFFLNCDCPQLNNECIYNLFNKNKNYIHKDIDEIGFNKYSNTINSRENEKSTRTRSINASTVALFAVNPLLGTLKLFGKI